MSVSNSEQDTSEAQVKPVKINSVTARDGHQSIIATRMRIEDIIEIVKAESQAGYNVQEVWGGATFDVAMRFKGENPWENLRKIREAAPEARLGMLLRGQNILAYENFADDVVEAFIERAAVNGVNVFRVFDAPNDLRNLEVPFRKLKEMKEKGYDVEIQGALSYTTGPKDENGNEEIFSVDYYVDLAEKMKEMGADSICIKDMANLLKPEVTYELVKALKEEVGLPVVLHTHATMGYAHENIRQAIKAGVDEVDTSADAVSGGPGHAGTGEVLDIIRSDEDPEIQERMPEMNTEILSETDKKLYACRSKYARWEAVHDPVMIKLVEEAGIPGGMYTTFLDQLGAQFAGINKARAAQGKEQLTFDEVFSKVLLEAKKVREDFGWVPLVTPTSQIVGDQAFKNVMSELQGKERYSQLADNSRKLLLGQLGKMPAPVNEELVRMAEEKSGTKRITCRPADLLEPGLPKAIEMLAHKGLLTDNVEDIISAALFPEKAIPYLENIYNPANYAEPEPVLPDYLNPPGQQNYINGYVFHHKGKCIPFIGTKDVLDIVGVEVIEEIAQTALKAERIKDGTDFKGFGEERRAQILTQKLDRIDALFDLAQDNLLAKGLTPIQITNGMGIINNALVQRMKTMSSEMPPSWNKALDESITAPYQGLKHKARRWDKNTAPSWGQPL